jgi:hypothetical protein
VHLPMTYGHFTVRILTRVCGQPKVKDETFLQLRRLREMASRRDKVQGKSLTTK